MLKITNCADYKPLVIAWQIQCPLWMESQESGISFTIYGGTRGSRAARSWAGSPAAMDSDDEIIAGAEASAVQSPAVSKAEARGGQRSEPSPRAAAEQQAAVPLFPFPVESEWLLHLWSNGREGGLRL